MSKKLGFFTPQSQFRFFKRNLWLETVTQKCPKYFTPKLFQILRLPKTFSWKKREKKICDWKLKNVNNFCDWVSKERFLKLFLDKVNYHSKKGHLFLSFFDFAFYFLGFVVKKITLTEKSFLLFITIFQSSFST